MSKLRFSTAQQVVDAFAVLKAEIADDHLEMSPVTFVEQLAQSGRMGAALGFCALLLSRHDAVKWLCQSLRQLRVKYDSKDETLLSLAENWAQTPSEKTRQAAFKAAMASGFGTPTAWAAAATGWTGGSLSENQDFPVPPPAHMTGQAVKTSLLLALSEVPLKQRPEAMAKVLQQGLAYAES